MNSKERVLLALKHQEPDYVPLFEAWIENEIIQRFKGDPYSTRIRLGMDCLPLGSHPLNTNAYKNGIDEWGRIFIDGQYAGGLLKDYRDLEQYTAPLFHAADWFPDQEVKKVKKQYSEEYALFYAWHDCSLGLSYLSMGMENFFLACINDIELVKAVIDRSTLWTLALVEEAVNSDVDFIVLGDDAADNSRPMISPRMFKELIVPEYKKITKNCPVPILWHSDGNIEPLLPLIVEAGFSGVHSLEPKAGIDLKKIKKKYGTKLVLAGNIDTTHVLSQGNLSLVRKEVERTIKQGASGGGFLFSSSNSLYPGHNIQAIKEMYRYAREVGKYPIKENL
ncbi:MAG: uroporphyrinogen decarboxylase family protein [Candidatus Kariarchaeaceae archaeon]|jgi:uroporphyrinogen decarboxylase